MFTKSSMSRIPGYLLAFAASSQAVTIDYWPYQSFVTEPTFHPPIFNIEKSGAPLADGLIVFTPSVENTTIIGARDLVAGMIMTDEGELVWHDPKLEISTNLFVQSLNGSSVLSYWHGQGTNTGHGYGSVTIMDETYTTIAEICPKVGLVTPDNSVPDCDADLHESYITDRGTILVTTVNATQADLSSVDGPSDGWVYDTKFLEIDIGTKDIVFEWSAIEAGIPFNLSKIRPDTDVAGNGTSQSSPWDWFHANSVQSVGDKYLVNSRHCWSTFMLDSAGNVEWYIDGNDGGDFKMDSDIHFRWEHHARVQNVTDTSLELHYFDNNNAEWDNGTHTTNGLRLQLDLGAKTATLLQKLDSDGIYTESQGSFFPLDNGNTLMGFGSISKIKEFGPDGDVRMTLQFGEDNLVQAYRSYRQDWHATPAYSPKAVIQDNTVYMSWNGATDVTEWKVYGPSLISSEMQLLGTAPKTGFETSFNLTQPALLVQVAAYAGDNLLGTSAMVSM